MKTYIFQRKSYTKREDGSYELVVSVIVNVFANMATAVEEAQKDIDHFKNRFGGVETINTLHYDEEFHHTLESGIVKQENIVIEREVVA